MLRILTSLSPPVLNGPTIVWAYRAELSTSAPARIAFCVPHRFANVSGLRGHASAVNTTCGSCARRMKFMGKARRCKGRALCWVRYIAGRSVVLFELMLQALYINFMRKVIHSNRSVYLRLQLKTQRNSWFFSFPEIEIQSIRVSNPNAFD